MTHVAVVIPGIMGSELYLGTQKIWPGPASALVLRYKNMAELMHPDVTPGGIIRNFSISPQYSALLEDLEACGFHERETPPSLVVFPYDWRRDIVDSATRLAAILDAILDQHKGDAEISLIGHSMGGLVARCYLESGQFGTRPGFLVVRRLIALGTPHRGSPLALTAALGQEKRLFLSADQVLQLASDPRYPSLYQLLPPAGEPFAWNDKVGLEYESVDIYKPAVSAALALVQPNVDAARAFHATLNLARRPPGVRYFFFAGTRQTTVSAVTLLQTGPTFRVRKLEPEDAGDGTVPVWSGSIQGVQGQPVGGEHGTIYKNADLRQTLGVLLGRPGILAAAPVRIEIVVRDRVTEPDTVVHIALTLRSPAAELNGRIRVERAQFDTSGQLTDFIAYGSPYPIRYTGLSAEKLGLTLLAPSAIGVYRVAYYDASAPPGAVPDASDELFVQEPPP